ncbi:Heterocyst differentiation ATP-binding protein HepA [bioreactor metagenome]|uniref:Heterocyst differentiation ATP-binding protein HepA n=1 Tax=bioreactor metagenome TaxID=1076179 RepID=A0A645I3B0_9ZZZZ
MRNNITFYDSRFSDEDIRVAIETLQLTDWFAKFPQGLDTVLDLGEANLSAGEAQLITLIRLALRKPRVLLLDEITSNLDVETEARLTKSLQIFAQGKTVLAIAHRKEALAWMDQIIGMEKGRHVAMGHSQEVAM